MNWDLFILSTWSSSSWPCCPSSEFTEMSAQSHFQWPAIFGGAVKWRRERRSPLTRSARASVFSVISGAFSWPRSPSAVTWLVAGVFLLFVALISFAVGGYVAGRMRERLNIDPAETEFRDGMHGLATWGVAIILGALLTLGTAAAATSRWRAFGPEYLAVRRRRKHHRYRAVDLVFRTDKVIDDLSYRRSECQNSSHILPVATVCPIPTTST